MIRSLKSKFQQANLPQWSIHNSEVSTKRPCVRHAGNTRSGFASRTMSRNRPLISNPYSEQSQWHGFPRANPRGGSSPTCRNRRRNVLAFRLSLAADVTTVVPRAPCSPNTERQLRCPKSWFEMDQMRFLQNRTSQVCRGPTSSPGVRPVDPALDTAATSTIERGSGHLVRERHTRPADRVATEELSPRGILQLNTTAVFENDLHSWALWSRRTPTGRRLENDPVSHEGMMEHRDRGVVSRLPRFEP